MLTPLALIDLLDVAKVFGGIVAGSGGLMLLKFKREEQSVTLVNDLRKEALAEIEKLKGRVKLLEDEKKTLEEQIERHDGEVENRRRRMTILEEENEMYHRNYHVLRNHCQAIRFTATLAILELTEANKKQGLPPPDIEMPDVPKFT